MTHQAERFPSPPLVGTAGWSIPAAHAALFPVEGTHLQRYAARLGAVEINSSFYRPHRRATYERWAASVPAGFAFSVKVPKSITHERRLVGVEEPLDRFLGEVAGLGEALGPLLVQLPPSLAFRDGASDRFLRMLRERHQGPIVCEPRHASWFTAGVEQLLREVRIARVAADPAPVEGAGAPGGWRGLAYLRLHGSPRIYHSAYGPGALEEVTRRLSSEAARGASAWCIFDNTAASAATANALTVGARLEDAASRGADQGRRPSGPAAEGGR